MKKLSVIIPVYNESKTLEQLLESVAGARLPDGVEKEIVAVEDFSQDGTRELLPRLASKYSIKLIMQERNFGKGKAIRTGLAACTGDFAVIQDADLEYDPNEYAKLIQPILDGQAEVVYGSRYLGREPARKSLHYFGNRFLTAASNLFTGLGLTDMETCYKVLSRRVIDEVAPRLTSDRFEIEPEITAVIAKRGFKVFEVPISYVPRSSDEGKKIKWYDGFPALWTIVRFSL